MEKQNSPFNAAGAGRKAKKVSGKKLSALLFLIFIFALAAACLATPDRDFSDKENRVLASAPKFSWKSLANGSFTADFEEYLTDQFYGRDFWVTIKANTERLMGKTNINGILVGTEDCLTAEYTLPDEDFLTANADYVETLAQNASVPVYFTLIPGARQIWSDRFPQTGNEDKQLEAITVAVSRLSQTRYIDTYSTLLGHSYEDIYYKTDHHWTTLGAWYGYTAVAEAFGFTVGEKPDAYLSSPGFYGTASSACGLTPGEGDIIDLRVPAEAAADIQVEGVGQGKLYDLTALTQTDRYKVFLGGNDPLTVITSAEAPADAPKLLLIKDSYANCEVPYLLSDFSEVHLMDLRYYKRSIQSYLQENQIDAVLISYSVSNFSTDTNLLFLTK